MGKVPASHVLVETPGVTIGVEIEPILTEPGQTIGVLWRALGNGIRKGIPVRIWRFVEDSSHSPRGLRSHQG